MMIPKYVRIHNRIMEWELEYDHQRQNTYCQKANYPDLSRSLFQNEVSSWALLQHFEGRYSLEIFSRFSYMLLIYLYFTL